MKTNYIMRVILLLLYGLLSACGGGGSESPTQVAISVQPADQTVVAGTTATFNVVATNAITYQWQVSTDNGATFNNVSGATSSAYTTAITLLADSGTQYRVIVNGTQNSATSSAVTLSVTSVAGAPAITVQPSNVIVTAPVVASFSVTAAGTNLNYQWQLCDDSNNPCASWSDLNGETLATYATGATDVSMDAQRYRVIVSNTIGSVESNTVSLNVDPTPELPVITSQPVDVTVVEPDSASFTVAYTGVPTPTVSWQYSTNGSTWNNAGASGDTFTINTTSVADNGYQYRAVVQNSAGSVTSDAATLTVSPYVAAPVFTVHPANISVTEGQNAQFTVTVTGAPTPTLQWQLSTDSGNSWNNINGETTSVLNVASVALSDNGRQYRSVATNTQGSVTSNAAVLTVTSASGKTFGTAQTATSGMCNAGCPFGLAANGDAITLWGETFNTTNFVLKANHYSAQNGTWSSGQIISASTGNILIENPQLAVSANGNAVAVWEQRTDTVIRKDIWASYYTAGGGWSTATLVESDNTGRAVTPQVAMDANGNAKAVWVQFDASLNTSIMVSTTSSGSWSTPSPLATGAGTVRSNPKIAIGTNGHAMAVWSSYTGPGNSVQASLFSGSWAAPVSVWSESVLSQMNLKPGVVMDANGNAIAVWQEPTGNGGAGTYLNVKANRYVAGAGWGTAELIEWSQYDASFPRIAMDASGNAMVVWAQSDGMAPRAWANFYSVNSNSWGGFPINLQTGAAGQGGVGSVGIGGSFAELDIAFDANGNAMAIWAEGNTKNIRVNQYSPGIGWGLANNNAIQQISITGANTVTLGQPRVAFDANGDALTVWGEVADLGSTNRLWFNVYQ